MDSYQAVYDAVRSRISSCDASNIISDIVRQQFDISHISHIISQDFGITAYEMQRPAVLYKPSLGIDGSKWCALYGEDLMHGVAGFGDSPAEAMLDFDKNWNAKLDERRLAFHVD